MYELRNWLLAALVGASGLASEATLARPAPAVQQEVAGRATIRCNITAQSTVTNCVLVDETPTGQGFGEAALAMASRFRMKPKTPDGRSAEGGTITIPVAFESPPTKPSPPTP
jgi:protein TonB